MTNCLNEALFQKVETLGNCTPIWAPIVPKGSQRCTGGSDSSGGAYLGTFDTIMSNGTEMTCHANCIDQPFSISLHYTANFEIRTIKDICRAQSKILDTKKTACMLKSIRWPTWALKVHTLGHKFSA